MIKAMLRGSLWFFVFMVAGATQAASKPPLSNSRFQIHGDTVYDKKTNLTWARCSIGSRWVDGLGCIGVIKTMNFAKAKSLENEPWRMPTKDELATLVDRSRVTARQQPTIDMEAFPDMDLTRLIYWGSTPKAATGSIVYFGTGTLTDYDMSIPHALRLVKAGQ